MNDPVKAQLQELVDRATKYFVADVQRILSYRDRDAAVNFTGQKWKQCSFVVPWDTTTGMVDMAIAFDKLNEALTRAKEQLSCSGLVWRRMVKTGPCVGAVVSSRNADDELGIAVRAYVEARHDASLWFIFTLDWMIEGNPEEEEGVYYNEGGSYEDGEDDAC